MAAWLLGCLQIHNSKSKYRVFCEHPSQVFETDLARSLENLHESSSSSDLLSLHGLCAAMDVVIGAQDAVKEALCMHSLQGAMEQPQVQQFFEDSVKLLDMCCMLENALGELNAYAKAAQVLLKHLTSGPKHLIQAKKALIYMQKVRADNGLDGAATRLGHVKAHSTKQLMTVSSMLRRMADKLTSTEACNDDLEHLNHKLSSTALPATLYGAEMVTLAFLRILVTVLSSATKPCQASAFRPLHISTEHAWVKPLRLLQAHLLRKVIPQTSTDKKTAERSIFTLLPGVCMIDGSLNQISDLLVQSLDRPTSQELRDNLRHHGESTLERVQELQGSVTKLQQQLKTISRSLVDVRMVLLDSQPGEHPSRSHSFMLRGTIE